MPLNPTYNFVSSSEPNKTIHKGVKSNLSQNLIRCKMHVQDYSYDNGPTRPQLVFFLSSNSKQKLRIYEKLR